MTSYFKEFHTMPIKMLLKYRFLIHFHKLHLDGDLDLQKTISSSTRSKTFFQPKRTNNCKGDRSLLTTGVNLWNAYLMGEEATESSCLKARLSAALWGSYAPQS